MNEDQTNPKTVQPPSTTSTFGNVQDQLLEQDQQALEKQLAFLPDEVPSSTMTLEEDDNSFPYAEINWEQIGKQEYLLPAGEKVSIYKIAKTMGWPANRATHAHIINYIRQRASLANITIIDNNYLQVEQAKKLFVPSFGAYRDYFQAQGQKNPKFEAFYREELERYAYPPIITVPEQQLYGEKVLYKNPISGIEANVPIIETFYGQWYLAYLQSAKEFYTNNGNSIRGFRYELLDGVPMPIHSEQTIGDDSYRAYDRQEWESLPWEERVEYFDQGLDRRLEEDKGPLRAFYKATVRKSGGVDEANYLGHNSKGVEMYGTWEKELFNWNENGTANTKSVKDEMRASNRKKKSKTGSKKQAHEAEKIAYEQILPILEQWEDPDHQPTPQEVAQLEHYKDYLTMVRLGFNHPDLLDVGRAIERLDYYLFNQLPYAAVDDLYEEEETKKCQDLSALLRQTKGIIMTHQQERTVPSFEEFELLHQTRQVFEEQPLGIVIQWTQFVDSPIRGDSLIEKYGSTQIWEMPDKLKDIKKQKNKRWSSK